MNTEMSDHVPVYDNFGRNQHATSAFTSDVTYTKLSPDTLLKKRTASEQYQVPVTEHDKKHQKKSGLLIAAASVLLTLLTVGTITAVILASIDFQHITKLSIQNVNLSAEKVQLTDGLQEIKNSMATMKGEITNLQERLTQMSFNKCFKDTKTCSFFPQSQILPACETPSLPVNKTVSCCYITILWFHKNLIIAKKILLKPTI